jgi:DNA-binding beta-propeller fold protein YncE
MKRTVWLLYAALGVLGSLLVSACGSSETEVANTPVPTISGQAGNFDAIEIDQGNHRLYVADRTDQGVDVFDISRPGAKFIKPISLSSPPNGLAISPDFRLYAGTEAGSVAVIDISKGSSSLNTVVAELKTGAAVDLLDYNAAKHVLLASSGGDGSITSIDTITNEITDHFKVASALEQPRFNERDGMIYVTSPDADALIQIDPKDGSITNRFPLGGCTPTGLAINPRSNSALIACKGFVLSRDMNTGRTERFIRVVGGDIVTYNAKVDRFFVASPHKTRPSVIGMFGGNPIAYIASIAAPGRGNSAVLDETNDVVYSPDTRPNMSGIAGAPRPTSLQGATPATIAAYALVAVVFAIVFWFVMRSGDPVRRRARVPAPTAEPAPAVKPLRSWRRAQPEPAIEGPPAPTHT